jgi:predicted HicB family RNase H-like nuclease
MYRPEHYSIVTRLVDVDGETFFEASVRELPDLKAYAEDANSAYAEILTLIEDAASLSRELGKAFPTPFVESHSEESSGRVTLRLPKQLHGRLVRMAADDEVSLNGYIIAALASFEGFAKGHEAAVRNARAAAHNTKLISAYYDFAEDVTLAPTDAWGLISQNSYQKAIATKPKGH